MSRPYLLTFNDSWSPMLPLSDQPRGCRLITACAIATVLGGCWRTNQHYEDWLAAQEAAEASSGVMTGSETTSESGSESDTAIEPDLPAPATTSLYTMPFTTTGSLALPVGMGEAVPFAVVTHFDPGQSADFGYQVSGFQQNAELEFEFDIAGIGAASDSSLAGYVGAIVTIGGSGPVIDWSQPVTAGCDAFATGAFPPAYQLRLTNVHDYRQSTTTTEYTLSNTIDGLQLCLDAGGGGAVVTAHGLAVAAIDNVEIEPVEVTASGSATQAIPWAGSVGLDLMPLLTPVEIASSGSGTLGWHVSCDSPQGCTAQIINGKGSDRIVFRGWLVGVP